MKDFGVLIPGTINHQLFLRLKEQALMSDSGARETALRCYNNAYYVCTLILLEANEFPELRVSDYVDTILEKEKENKHIDEVCLASMAMACVLLAAYDEKKYGRDSEMWKVINHRCTHYQWYHSLATTIFKNMVSGEYRTISPLSYTEFAPRDIIEVISNVREGFLAACAEYICERLALLKNPRQRMYGADMAIAKIKDYQRELCKEYEYDPKKDCFKYANNIPLKRDLDLENIIRDNYRQCKEAIDYYTKHYPTKDENDSKEKTAETTQTSETEVLQKEKEEIESKLNQKVNELQQLLTEKTKALQKALQIIEEYRHPVKELTAKQKIRMEFAVQLLLKAGLAEENLDKENRNKSKVASLLSLMLDIKPTICANFLVDRKYYPQEKDRDTILELDKLCLELGVNAHLSTQQQGNKK